MSSSNVIKYPVFRELAIIQASVDKFPDPGDSDFNTCRGLKQDGGRCKNPRCTKEEKEDNPIDILLSEFQAMKTCPDTDDFYSKLEKFLTLTHCTRRHRNETMKAFSEWKGQRMIAASNSKLVSPSASSASFNSLPESGSEFDGVSPPDPTEDGVGSDEIIPISGSDEELEGLVLSDDIESATIELDDKHLDGPAEDLYSGLGVAANSPRTKSWEDNVSIFQAICKYPTDAQMEEGVVYVLQHKKKDDLFKIGYTSMTVEERLRQGKNCYAKDTKKMYSTKTNIGAFRAERIVHAILRQNNIRIKHCVHCGKNHTEWFEAERSIVLDTVMGVEEFMQMPAYTLQNGKWRLSPDAQIIMKKMCQFTIPMLKKTIKTARRETRTNSTGARDGPLLHQNDGSRPRTIKIPYRPNPGGRDPTIRTAVATASKPAVTYEEYISPPQEPMQEMGSEGGRDTDDVVILRLKNGEFASGVVHLNSDFLLRKMLQNLKRPTNEITPVARQEGQHEFQLKRHTAL